MDILQCNARFSKSIFQQIAKIHREEIGAGFLSRCGEPFLAALYRFLAASPDVILYCATEDGLVVGFICGGVDLKKIILKFLLTSFHHFLPVLGRNMCRKEFLGKCLEVAALPFKKQTTVISRYTILNFCVSRSFQRRGLGKRLFVALMEAFERRGVKTVSFVTGKDQVSAQKFYEALGAHKITTIEVHKGVRSVAYAYDIV